MGETKPFSGQSTFYITHAGRDKEQSLYVPFAPQDILREWQQKVVTERPSSILVVSSHWDTLYPSVSVIPDINPTLYDADGLHESYYKLKYPAPGAPALAKRVKEVLIASGFDRVEEDSTRGLDHGTWIPLLLMYSEADIPVCQLSIQCHKDATNHYNLGKALAPLKEELGVLIIGSGSATNNIEERGKHGDPVAPWAMEFDSWLMDAILQGRYEDVNAYAEKAPYAKRAHPNKPDHLYPLHVAMGASGDDVEAQLINHAWDDASISYASYRFTSKS